MALTALERRIVEMIRSAKKVTVCLDYKRTFATRLALKYRILTENKWDGKFYFERLK